MTTKIGTSNRRRTPQERRESPAVIVLCAPAASCGGLTICTNLTWSDLDSVDALDLDRRIVIRNAAFGVADAAFDERVALRPMDLDVAGGDRCNAAVAAQGSDLATNDNRVAFLQTQLQRVSLVHQHVVAPRAVKGVAVAVDNAVELFAAPGRESELTIVRRRSNFDNGKSGSAIGRRELRRDPSVGVTLLAQSLASPLRIVAGPPQILNAVVSGNGAGDLIAYRLSVVEVDQMGRRGLRALCDQHRDFPFGLRFADAATGDFRAEKYSTFSSRFGPAAALFVARLRGQ